MNGGILAGINNIAGYSVELFEADVLSYIKAVRANRLQVKKVNEKYRQVDLLVQAYEGNLSKGHYRQYNAMLKALGFIINGYWDTILVGGTGLDRRFAFETGVIAKLRRNEIISNTVHGNLYRLIESRY